MKIERLIGILLYILNRDCVSATVLADQFGVSRRTILRDIDTLTLAGIPIYSETGSKGGYSINKDYKLNEKLMDPTNSQYMMLALKMLKDLYGNQKVTETYEKVKHIYMPSSLKHPLEIDLSVINENNLITTIIPLLKQSITKQENVTFSYTNAQNKSSLITADILHIYYRWYAWYAFGYNYDKQVFRMYKLSRMRNLQLNNIKWLHSYDVQNELNKQEESRNKNTITVTIEYLNEI